MARFTDSQAQTPSAYSEDQLNQKKDQATRALVEYGDRLSGSEREQLLNIAENGFEQESGLFMKALEIIDRPRELIAMGIADITGLDKKVGQEISGGDYLNSFLGRTDTLRADLGDKLVGDSDFAFSGSNLLDVAGVENRAVRAVGGFIGDVVLDPTTYIGGGFLAAGRKAGVEGIQLATSASLREAVEAVSKGTIPELADQASRKFADDIVKQVDEVAPAIEERLLQSIKEASGREWFTPAELDTAAKEARELALWREADDLNKVLPDNAKIDVPDFQEIKGYLDEAVEEGETFVRRTFDETSRLVGDRQFKSLEARYPELVNSDWTPASATGGLKFYLPFGSSAVDLGLRTNSPIRSTLKPFMKGWFEKLPDGLTRPLANVAKRRGWEIPTLGLVQEGKAWQIKAAVTQQQTLLNSLGVKESPGLISNAINQLRKQADQSGFEGDIDGLLSRALDTPDLQGLHTEFADTALYEQFIDTVQRTRAVTETLRDAVREFDPDFKGIDGYMTLIRSKDFQKLIDTVTDKGISLKAVGGVDPEVRQGLSLLNQYVASANGGTMAGAYDLGTSRFMKARKGGRTAFAPLDKDTPVDILDKATLGQIYDLGDEVGFIPKADMNESIRKALGWLKERNPELRRFDDDLTAFSEDVSEVLDTYVTSMTEALKFRAFARSARQVGLINRQEFDIDVADSLVNLTLANNDETRSLVRRALEITRGRKQALEELKEAPPSTLVKVGPFEVEVNAGALSSPEFRGALEKANGKVQKSVQRSREVVAQQEAMVRELTDAGIPESMARPMAAATSEGSLREARIVVETEAHYRASQLELAASEALSKARTPAERQLAEEGIAEARRQARNIRARAKRQQRKLNEDWAKRFRYTTEVEDSSIEFHFTPEQMAGIDALIEREVQKDIDRAREVLASYPEAAQRRIQEELDILEESGVTINERQRMLSGLRAARSFEGEAKAVRGVRRSLDEVVEASNISWADMRDEISPDGLYSLVRDSLGTGNREASEAVTRWRRTVASRNADTYKATRQPAEAAAYTLKGEESAASEAYDAILAWADESGAQITDLIKIDDLESPTLTDPITVALWRKANALMDGNPEGFDNLLFGARLSAQNFANVHSPLASMLNTLEPVSGEAAMRAALRKGSVDDLALHEGKFRAWLERIGLDPDGLTVQRNPKTNKATMSYKTATTRETHSVITVDSVLDEMNRAFPDTQRLPFDERVGFLNDLRRTDPAQFEGVSDDLRRFFDQVDEFGSMPPEVRRLGEIDRLYSQAQGLRDLANRAKTGAKLTHPDAEKAWTKVRRELQRTLEGGRVGALKDAWAENSKAILQLDEELHSQVDYMVRYVEAMRDGDIPKYLIDRNMRWTEQAWQGTDEVLADLKRFADETARLAQDSELGKLTQQIDDLEQFRSQVAGLVAEYGGRGGDAGFGLREAGGAVLTLTGPEGDLFKSKYDEVTELAQRIGRNIEGNLYGFDMEELARQFPALPADASDRVVERWLRDRGDALRLPRAASAPVSEGFLPPEAAGVAAGTELQYAVMDQWTAIMLENMVGHMRAVQTSAGLKAFAENANKATRLWKTAATIGRPTFVPRNLIGGMYNNFMLGVRPRDYAAVATNVKRFRKEFVKTGSIDRAIASVADDFQPVLRAMVDSDLLNTGFNHELQQVIEDGAVRFTQRINPTDIENFELYRRNATFMQDSEDFLRAAAFVRFYDPTNPQSAEFAKSMSLAAHFDYDNLSTVEQSIKRLVPFFVWSRRNIPLQIQGALERPGVMMTYKHLMTNIDESAEDIPQNDFAKSKYLSGFAAETGIVLNEGTPWWGQLILDPDVPIKDLDEALGALGQGETLKFFTSLLNPGITLPFDMQATSEYGDVNAPAGMHAVLRSLHAVGLWDNTSVQGDPQVSYNARRVFETAIPFAGEYSNLVGQQNDPGRAARLGITTEDGTSVAERLRALALTLAKAGGVSVQTPQDSRSAAFEAGDTVRGILDDAELQGRIARDR